jgi:O-antigen ligase
MNVLLTVLVISALFATQILAGGRSLALCLPGYGLLALAAVLSSFSARRLSLPRGTAECLAAAAFFFIYITGRALFSPEEYLARKDLYLALGAAAMYLLVALNLTSSTWRGLVVASLLLLAGANCLIGAIQFTKGQNFMVFDFLQRSDYGSRASGFFGYPNHLALFLEVGLLMGLGVAFWSRWRPWVKILAGYFALVCLLGILLTGSRGGYIGAAVGLLAFGLLSFRLAGEFANTRAIGLLVAGCLMLGAVGWGVQHFLSKSSVLQARVEEKVGGSDFRLHVWKSAVRQFKLHPIVGTGSGTFLYYGRQFRDPLLREDPVHAHNEYLELLAEYGILGFAVALMLIDMHLRNGWKSFTSQIARQSDSLSISGNSLALTVGAMSTVVACLAHSLVDFTLHMPANMLLAAFVLGLLANPGETAGTTSAASQKSGGPLRYLQWALPALGLLIAVYALPKWPAEYFAERAGLLMDEGQYAESEEDAQTLADFARKGIAWDTRNPVLYSCLGSAQLALALLSTDPSVVNELSAASLAAYQKANELAPNDVFGVLATALALDNLARFSESEPLFERALKLDPNSAHVRYAYARHLQKRGELAEAEVQYQQSIKLGAGPSARNALERLQKDFKPRPFRSEALPRLQ